MAEWLRCHLPEGFRLVTQERVAADVAGAFPITLDMVIYQAGSDTPVLVVDTKYKIGDRPSPEDLQQIVAYSVARGCANAVLIYPTKLRHPFNGRYGRSPVAIRTVAFTIEGDVEQGGREMLVELLRGVSTHPSD